MARKLKFRLKDNTVQVNNLNKEIRNILTTIDNVCKYYEGERYIFTITSGHEPWSRHMKGSKHYTGDAIDIRKIDMKNPNIIWRRLKEILGTNYDVINEKTHIHIEYDKK